MQRWSQSEGLTTVGVDFCAYFEIVIFDYFFYFVVSVLFAVVVVV